MVKALGDAQDSKPPTVYRTAKDHAKGSIANFTAVLTAIEDLQSVTEMSYPCHDLAAACESVAGVLAARGLREKGWWKPLESHEVGKPRLADKAEQNRYISRYRKHVRSRTPDARNSNLKQAQPKGRKGPPAADTVTGAAAALRVEVHTEAPPIARSASADARPAPASVPLQTQSPPPTRSAVVFSLISNDGYEFTLLPRCNVEFSRLLAARQEEINAQHEHGRVEARTAICLDFPMNVIALFAQFLTVETGHAGAWLHDLHRAFCGAAVSPRQFMDCACVLRAPLVYLCAVLHVDGLWNSAHSLGNLSSIEVDIIGKRAARSFLLDCPLAEWLAWGAHEGAAPCLAVALDCCWWIRCCREYGVQVSCKDNELSWRSVYAEIKVRELALKHQLSAVDPLLLHSLGKEVRYLSFKNCDSLTDLSLYELARACPNLKSLDITQTSCTTEIAAFCSSRGIELTGVETLRHKDSAASQPSSRAGRRGNSSPLHRYSPSF